MNNKTILAIAVILLGTLGVFVLLNKQDEKVPTVPETVTESPVPTFDGRNTSFAIDGKQVVLVDGVSETQIAPGSASKVVTRYFGNDISGDLTGDGVPDIAYLVTQSTGGSGLFYYAVVAMRTADGYKNTNAFLIGDRIAPQAMYIPGGTTELHVNFAERKPGEPMTAQPSQGAVTLLKVTQGGVLEGLMK